MTDDIKEPPGILLNRTDLQSQTWLKMKKHMEKRLAELRGKNDADLDPTATARVRGQIKVYKDLLALGSPNPATVADEEPE